MMNNQIRIVKNNDVLSKEPLNDDPIYLVYQFFIHSNPERHKETLYCLKQNVNLGLFKQIILLNERIYTKEELGLNDDEMKHILQINISHRMKYNSVLMRCKMLKLDGYIVFCNSDIFFDKSILNLRRSSISTTKSVYTLLRFEFNKQKHLGYCKLFIHPRTNKPRNDSQDVWIYHTSTMDITSDIIKQTDFMLGMPGCDNKITYVFQQNGYTCYNVPYNVKTYHYHATQIRNYSRKDLVPSPYLFVEPIV